MRKPSADRLFCGALLLAVVAVAAPAWSGDFIYDDLPMVDNDKMDGWDDALAVFARSSVDYMGASAASHAGAVTYRPLSVLSLIVVQAALPGQPLPHHLLSLALHLCNTLLLFYTLRAAGSAALARAGALVFALHPLGMEAYGWINGRSDALSALGVLSVAAALFACSERRRPWLLAAGTLLAAFAKETAIAGVLGLIAASLLPARGAWEPGALRSRLRAASPGLACVALALVARAAAVGDVRRTALSVFGLPDLASALVRLLGAALRALLVPLPRTMDNLGFVLAQPLGATSWLLLALALAACAVLALRRSFQALLLIGTGIAMVLPCVVVRHTFWLGCDRYLYLPLALFTLAAARSDLSARLSALPPRLRATLLALLALVLAPASFLSAQTYESQTTHMLAMMRLRPEDPSGYLIGARWLWHRGQREGARELLARLPRRGLPAPLASQLATVLAEFGRRDEAVAVVADMEARYPHDPFVQLDLVSVRLDEGRVAEAERKAAPLRARAGFCRAVRELVASHLAQPSFAAAHGAEARALLDSYRCE